MATKRRLAADPARHVGFRCKHTGSPQTVPELMFHHAWDFLNPHDITSLCRAAPVMSCYGSLRQEAASISPATLQSILLPLDPHHPSSSISTDRSRQVACLLLLCDFRIGGLIRCLRRLYTGDFLDFDTIDATLAAMESIPISEDEPQHDFASLHHIFHQGVPLTAAFHCDRGDVLARNLYDNHRAADPHVESILAKTAIDVSKSYAIALPRWCLRFIDGVFLAALGFATREHKGKVKGRQCNDPSAKITGPADTGALNDHIDRRDPIQMPKVYYQDALQRVWRRTYNLRLSYPDDDIIIYKDDLVAAFRRVRYHPDLAVANSYILQGFFIIPIGMVFGARDSPSWFCMVSELRSLASRYLQRLPIPQPTTTIIDQVTFAHPAPPSQALAQAQPDSLNQGTDGSCPGHQATFVDDTIITELRSVIREAASASAVTAALFIGNSDHVEGAISQEKFERIFSHLNETLGFMLNTRTLTVWYPDYKQDSILALLQDVDWTPGSLHKVRSLARLLGKLRNLAQILPFGNHLSIHLQLCLSGYVRKHTSSSKSVASFRKNLRKAWSSYRSVHINAAAAHDVSNLQSLLTNAPPAIWQRPLSLLVPRDPHFIGLSDACNIAMGGFCMSLHFQWRLDNAVFRSLPAYKTQHPNEPEHHINVHEFIGIIVNVFFSMLSFRERCQIPDPSIPLVDGYIFRVAADNTSALSWMRYASRTREPGLSNLVYLLSHLTFHFNSFFPSRFDAVHIQGKKNIVADALSRPQDHPNYQSVFLSYPEMAFIPAYRTPPKLLSEINACLSSSSMRVPQKHVIEALFSTRLSSFRLTASTWASRTLLSKPSQSSTAKGSWRPSPST